MFKKCKMYKIAFIGTHGTGKTTLAHELVAGLKRKGFDVDFLEEIARRCPLQINETATTETQKWILSKQITEELEKSEKCNILVCDRSILDTYSYQTALYYRKKSWEPYINEHLKTYNLLIKVPITERMIKKDKKRSTNKEFQINVEKEIENNLQIFKPKYIKFKGRENFKEIYEHLKNKYL